MTVQTEKSPVPPITEKTEMSSGLTSIDDGGSGDGSPSIISQMSAVTTVSALASKEGPSTVSTETVVDISDQTVMPSTYVVSDVTKTSSIATAQSSTSPEPSKGPGDERVDHGASKAPVLLESSPSFSGSTTELDRANVSTTSESEYPVDLASTIFSDESLIISTTISSLFSTEKPAVTTASDEAVDAVKSTLSAPSSLYSTEKPAFTTESQESVSKVLVSIAAEASSIFATTEEGSGDLTSAGTAKETVTDSSAWTSMFSTKKPSLTTESHETIDSSRPTAYPASSLHSTDTPTSQSKTVSVTAEDSSISSSTLEEGSDVQTFDVSTQETATVTPSSVLSTKEPEIEAGAVTISTTSPSSSFPTEIATAISSEQPDPTSTDISSGDETSSTIATLLPMSTASSVSASTSQSTEETPIETPSEATKEETSMENTVSVSYPSTTLQSRDYPTRGTSTFIDMENSGDSFVDDEQGSTPDGSGYELPLETLTKPKAEFTSAPDKTEMDEQSKSAVPSFATSTFLSKQPTMDSESSTQSPHITSTETSTVTISLSLDGSTADHTQDIFIQSTDSTVYTTESTTEVLDTIEHIGTTFPETITSTDETGSIMAKPDTESDGSGDRLTDVSSMFSTGIPKVIMMSHETTASSLFSTDDPNMAPSNMTLSHPVSLGPLLTDTSKSTLTVTLMEEESSSFHTPGVFTSIPSEATGETESFVSVTPVSDEMATSKEREIILATQSTVSSETQTPSLSRMDESTTLAEQTRDYSHPTMMPNATLKLVSDHTSSDTTKSSSSSESPSISTTFPSIIYHSVTDQQIMIISPTSSQTKAELSEQTPTMVLHGTKPSASITRIFTEEATDEDTIFSTVTDGMNHGSPDPGLITKDNTIIDADTFSEEKKTEEEEGVPAVTVTPMLDGTEEIQGSGSDVVISESTPATLDSTSESSENSSHRSESTSSSAEINIVPTDDEEGSSSSSSESSSAETVTFVPQSMGESKLFTMPYSTFPAASADPTTQRMDADSTSDSINDKDSGSSTEITSTLPSSQALNESAEIVTTAMLKGEETTSNVKATTSSLFSTETPTVSVSDITGEPPATVKAEQGTLSSLSDITTEESSGQPSTAMFIEDTSLSSTIKPLKDLNTEQTVPTASLHATEEPIISSGTDVTSKEDSDEQTPPSTMVNATAMVEQEPIPTISAQGETEKQSVGAVSLYSTQKPVITSSPGFTERSGSVDESSNTLATESFSETSTVYTYTENVDDLPSTNITTPQVTKQPSAANIIDVESSSDKTMDTTTAINNISTLPQKITIDGNTLSTSMSSLISTEKTQTETERDEAAKESTEESVSSMELHTASSQQWVSVPSSAIATSSTPVNKVHFVTTFVPVPEVTSSTETYQQARSEITFIHHSSVAVSSAETVAATTIAMVSSERTTSPDTEKAATASTTDSSLLDASSSQSTANLEVSTYTLSISEKLDGVENTSGETAVSTEDHIEETSTSPEEESFTSQMKTVVTPIPTLALAPNLTIEDSEPSASIHLTVATSQPDVNIQFVTTISPLQHQTSPAESFEQARSENSLTHMPTDHSSEDALLSTTSPLLPLKTTQSSESTATPVDVSTSKDIWTIEPLEEPSSNSTESESSTSSLFYEKDPDYGTPVDYEAPNLSKVESVPIYPGAPLSGSFVSISTPSALPQTTQSQSVISAGSESGSEGSTSQSSVIAGSTPVVPGLASTLTSEHVSEGSSSTADSLTASTAVDLESDTVEVKTELSAAITSPPSIIITEAPAVEASEESTEEQPSAAPGEIQTVFKAAVTTSLPMIGEPGTREETTSVDREVSATTNTIVPLAKTQSQEEITSLHTKPSSFSKGNDTVDRDGTPLFPEGLPINGQEPSNSAETGLNIDHSIIGETVEIPGM